MQFSAKSLATETASASEIVRKCVTGRRTSNREGQTLKRAETATRLEQLQLATNRTETETELCFIIILT